MGGSKRLMEAMEDEYDWARGFLVEHGTLEECEYHDGTYFDGDGDLETAYKILNSKITKGEIELEPGKTRRDMTDALKRAYDDNSGVDSCSSCDKHMAE